MNKDRMAKNYLSSSADFVKHQTSILLVLNLSSRLDFCFSGLLSSFLWVKFLRFVYFKNEPFKKKKKKKKNLFYYLESNSKFAGKSPDDDRRDAVSHLKQVSDAI